MKAQWLEVIKHLSWLSPNLLPFFLSFKLTLNNSRLKPFTIKGFVQITGIVLNLCLIQHIHLADNLQKTGNKDKCLSATPVAQGLKFDRCSTLS